MTPRPRNIFPIQYITSNISENPKFFIVIKIFYLILFFLCSLTIILTPLNFSILKILKVNNLKMLLKKTRLITFSSCLAMAFSLSTKSNCLWPTSHYTNFVFILFTFFLFFFYLFICLFNFFCPVFYKFFCSSFIGLQIIYCCNPSSGVSYNHLDFPRSVFW